MIRWRKVLGSIRNRVNRPNCHGPAEHPNAQVHLGLDEAAARSVHYGLIDAAPVINKPAALKSESARAAISGLIRSQWAGPATGCCVIVAQACIDPIKEMLGRDAWIVLGWLTDIAKPGVCIWRMDPDELCRGISRGWLGQAEVHAWIMLDSGEIIDPVGYQTLAELFPNFVQGRGQVNFLNAQGLPYKVIPGMPFWRYHPSAILE